MRRRLFAIVVAGTAAAGWCVPMARAAAADAAVSGAAARAIVAASWRKAIEVPGLGALNKSGSAFVRSVSCGSAGNCSASGGYRDGSAFFQAFVVSERSGRWGKAIEVPGTTTLNAGGDALVVSVSCSSAGNCSAGGRYTDGSGHAQAFVASQTNGRWRKAIKVPGSGTLNAGGDAAVNSVSCVSAGNCSAGGSYRDGSGHFQAFVVSERSGRWGKAVEVPGTATLNAGGSAAINSVSCGSAGNCSAGGIYADGSAHFQAFVVSERSGRWGKAIEVPGTATLNAGGQAEVNSVSCASAGNCSAGGFYADGSGHFQAFVAGRTNGRWRKAIEVPGTATLNAGAQAAVESVSCGSAGNCSAGGGYTDGSGHGQAFVVTETNGRWRKAIKLPGSGALNAGGSASVRSVSCGSARTCSAGGGYVDGSDHGQAFVVTEASGRWAKAVEVPGTATLNAGGDAAVTSMSCGSPGNCAAGGAYFDGSGHEQGFVAVRA